MAGLMPGPPPKHPSDRIRRNVAPGLTALPANGHRGKIPDWTLPQQQVGERLLWERLWRTPQAAMWVKGGEGLARVVMRYVRLSIMLENDDHATIALAQLNGEVRQIEDRLGLTPLAMLRLRWEVPSDEVEERRETRQKSTRDRIKAVDTSDETG